MAVIPYVDPERLTGEQAALGERIARGRRHGLPNLYRLLLHAPDLAGGWVELANAVRFGSRLPPRTRELVILRTATAAGCAYARHHHTEVARSVGIADETIGALADWRASRSFGPEERLALEIADAVREQRPLPAGLADSAEQALGTSTVVEIAVVAAYYVAVAGLSAALQLDIEP